MCPFFIINLHLNSYTIVYYVVIKLIYINSNLIMIYRNFNFTG